MVGLPSYKSQWLRHFEVFLTKISNKKLWLLEKQSSSKNLSLEDKTTDVTDHRRLWPHSKSFLYSLQYPINSTKENKSLYKLCKILTHSALLKLTLIPEKYNGFISASPRRRGIKRRSGRHVRSPSPWQLHPEEGIGVIYVTTGIAALTDTAYVFIFFFAVNESLRMR